MTRERAGTALRWLLIAAYLFAGVAHIRNPGPFLQIMPAWVPMPRTTVIATGWCELAGAIGLMTPRLRRFAGAMLAVYAACVYPANVQHAINDLGGGRGLPIWYHAPRLAFQPVIVWWSLFAVGLVDWPFRRRLQREP